MKRHKQGQQTMFYTDVLTDEDLLLAVDKDAWLSRRQIAERVWRSVTPSLVKRLERLVGEGKLLKHSVDLPNGQVMFWYKRGKTQ